MSLQQAISPPISPDDPVPAKSARAGVFGAANLVLLATITALTIVLRSVALGRAFDVSSDEVDYVDLGQSIRHGVFPPQFERGPFLLHPPLYFVLSALWEDLLRPAPTYLGLVSQAREVNIVCAGISAGLVFYIAARLAGRLVGTAAGLLFAFDPFLQQVNGQALLETSTWMFGLAGWAVLLRLFGGKVRHPFRVAVIGGATLGLSLVTKDMAFAVVVPPLLVAIWRRWGDRRVLWVATISTMVPTALYLTAVTATGYLGLWSTEETAGLRRMLGLVKVTGYTSGGHPSLVVTLGREILLYGLSYLTCGLGVVAAVYLLLRCDRKDIRLLAVVTLSGALTLVYATLFGTIEAPFFYYLSIPALLSLPIAATVFLRSVRLRRDRTLRRGLLGLLTLVLIYNGGVWFHIRATPDDGVHRLVSWFQTYEPSPGVILNDTDVTQLVLQRYGYDAIRAGTPQLARREHAHYVTILSVSVNGRYGSLSPGQAAWYERHGTLVYRFNEPSYGEMAIYRTDDPSLW